MITVNVPSSGCANAPAVTDGDAFTLKLSSPPNLGQIGGVETRSRPHQGIAVFFGWSGGGSTRSSVTAACCPRTGRRAGGPAGRGLEPVSVGEAVERAPGCEAHSEWGGEVGLEQRSAGLEHAGHLRERLLPAADVVGRRQGSTGGEGVSRRD